MGVGGGRVEERSPLLFESLVSLRFTDVVAGTALPCFCLQAADERRCLLRASIREKLLSHAEQKWALLLVCKAWCRLQSCCLAKPFAQSGHEQM